HYRDQWSKKVQVLSSYGYDYSDNLSKNNSYGERYTSIGIGEFVDQNDARRKGKAHVANIEVDIALDSLNYLQIKPSYGFDWSQGSSFAFTDQINSYTTGFEHELSNGTTNQDYQNTRYGLAALYVHAFRKPRR